MTNEIYGYIAGIISAILIWRITYWGTQVIEKPQFDLLPDMWRVEKWVGAINKNYNATGLDEEEYVGGIKEGFIFYGITLENKRGRFSPKKPVSIQKAYLMVYDKNGNITNDKKEVRWWSPDTQTIDLLFVPSRYDIRSRRERTVVEGDKESLIIACKPIKQNSYYRFTLASDKVSDFLRKEDLMDLSGAKYMKIFINCLSGEVIKKISITKMESSGDLSFSEVKKFPFE